MKLIQKKNGRLKVLMVEHHSPGNRYVLELAREMKNECDLTIFCDMRNDLQEDGIRWKRRFYNGGKGKAAAVLDYGRTLLELEHEIRCGHYDVLHIQSFKKASAEMKLYVEMRRYYRMLVMTVHNVLPHEPAPGDTALYGRFYRACDLLIVHNDASNRSSRTSSISRMRRSASSPGDCIPPTASTTMPEIRTSACIFSISGASAPIREWISCSRPSL